MVSTDVLATGNRVLTMLARGNRLANRQDFARVYARGKSFHSPLVKVYAYPRPVREGEPLESPPEPRFGISVSKKVGGAVERNRVKRRIREACRRVIRAGAPAVDFVIVARPAALEAEFETLAGTVERLVDQAVGALSGGGSQAAGGRGRRKYRAPSPGETVDRVGRA